jgi:TPR repeat protein
MTQEEKVLRKYDAVIEQWVNSCIANPSIWHKPNTDEFEKLLSEILRLANKGSVKCMYSAAIIYSNGLIYGSEAEFFNHHDELISQATVWWERAAAKGYLAAVDNLLTSGVGAQAEKARAVAAEIEAERKDLIGSYNNMPIYAENFMQELFNRLYV